MPTLVNQGSLITTQDNQCLGYLFAVEGQGVFDAEHGRVNVSFEHAHIHNKHLDSAMLRGLDERCEIGQGSNFYVKKKKDGTSHVVTWLGTVVSDSVHYASGSYTFERAGKKFAGRQRKVGISVFFKRIE